MERSVKWVESRQIFSEQRNPPGKSYMEHGKTSSPVCSVVPT